MTYFTDALRGAGLRVEADAGRKIRVENAASAATGGRTMPGDYAFVGDLLGTVSRPVRGKEAVTSAGAEREAELVVRTWNRDGLPLYDSHGDRPPSRLTLDFNTPDAQTFTLRAYRREDSGLYVLEVVRL